MITFATCMLAIACLCCLRIAFRRRRRNGEPPIAHHSIPFVGHALGFGKDPEGYLKRLQNKHGDVYTMKMAGWDFHVFMDPHVVSAIEKNHALPHDPVVNDFVTKIIGDKHSYYQQAEMSEPSVTSKLKGIFYAQGEHKNKKVNLKPTRNKETVEHAVMTQLHRPQQLQDLFQSCIKNINIIIEQIRENKISIGENDQKIKLKEFCDRIVFQMSFSLLFGTLPDEDDSLEEINKFYKVFTGFEKHSSLLVNRIPIFMLPKLKQAREDNFELLRSLDWSKRINTSDMIIRSRQVDQDPEHQVRHMFLLLWASFSNTAPALFWMLFYILKNPEAKSAVIQEFDEFVGLSSPTDENHNITKAKVRTQNLSKLFQMNKADLEELLIIESAFKEMTRISSSSMILRRATKDTSLETRNKDSFRIREGDYILFYTPLLHNDEEVYENALEFQYDRYLEETFSESTLNNKSSRKLKPKTKFYKDGQKLNSSNTIMTFGAGRTRCPGRHLASMEIKLLTLSLLKSFDISLITDKKPGPDLTRIGFGIMSPKEDVSVKCSLKIENN